jgi:hypothetical protein
MRFRESQASNYCRSMMKLLFDMQQINEIKTELKQRNQL